MSAVPKKKTGKDRRRARRLNWRARVHYHILKLPSSRAVTLLKRRRAGHGRDVSHTGLRFVARHLLLPGSKLSLAMPKHGHVPARKAKGTVVWCRETAGHKFQVGVRFQAR